MHDQFFDALFGLKGRVAIVTGGLGQLGGEFARTLAQAGAKVAVFDVRIPDEQEKSTLAAGLPISYYLVDITQRFSLESALKDIENDLGTPSILINNAGIDTPPNAPAEENGPFEQYPLESWNRVINVNLTGMFLCCQIIGGRMAGAGKGSVINIASTYGLVSPNQEIYRYREKDGTRFFKPVAYSASKSGVLNLTRYLATYWANNGVRVNTLTPGGVFNRQDEQFLQNYASHVPLGRMANPNEYNGAILFLASDASSYMTGSNLVVDGGWTAW